MFYFIAEEDLDLLDISFTKPKYWNLEIGDILNFSFKRKGIIYSFEGLCISLRNKNLNNPESSFIVRNVLTNVGVELSVSYYYNRGFNAKLNDYKRKKFIYRKSKLYYVRNRLNRESRIKQ